MTDQQKYYEARQILKGRDRECVNCGETENIEMHHIVPISKGGTNNEGNLVWLCTECHYKAHGADIGQGNKGLHNGRPQIEKPQGADLTIDRYIKGEVTGLEAYKELGLKRGHSFADVMFVRKYLDEHGIKEVRRNWGSSKNLTTTVIYKDGRVEDYRNGELIGSN